ncbi:MAG: hypothetical protein PHC61_07105 [Chitinivibrionales bacterium]|nr:hypothetical protein [Chitinivibrionales bacterium]
MPCVNGDGNARKSKSIGRRACFWFAIAGIMAFAVLAILCSPAQNPYTNPANGRIDTTHSLQNLNADSINITQALACTLSLAYAGVIESVIVLEKINAGAESVLVARTMPADSNLIFFPLQFFQSGSYAVTAVIVKTNHARDSLVRQFTVFSRAPTVAADSSSYHLTLNDSTTLKFRVTDSDSNPKLWTMWFNGDFTNALNGGFVPQKHFADSIVKKVAFDSIGTRLCSILVTSYSGLSSVTALCTLIVRDTTRPVLHRILPVNTATVITALPEIISVTIQEDSRIDSVKFGRDSAGAILATMKLMHDTALLAATLDSGSYRYKIIAWDQAGNAGTDTFRLTYAGHKTYNPVIKNLSQTIQEDGVFNTIKLDTCASVDTAAPYAKDSIIWHITPQSGGILSVIQDAGAGTIQISVPPADSEWNGSEFVQFEALGPQGQSTIEQATFTVTRVNDPPVITYGGACQTIGTPFDTLVLDSLAYDVDNARSSLSWRFTAGKAWQVAYVPRLFLGRRTSGSTGVIPIRTINSNRIVILPKTGINAATWSGKDTLKFYVMDPDSGRDSAGVVFTKATTCLQIIHILPIKLFP